MRRCDPVALAAQAVHEMLLQSWSPTPGQRDTEVIRLFPASPWRWHDASFAGLRAEGGHRVSARRQNNAITWFRVVAGRDGVVRIRDNFRGRQPQWNRDGVRKTGPRFEVDLKRGESLEATLPRPDDIPDRPANATDPLVIRPPGPIRANKLPLRIGADSQGGNRFRGDMTGIAVFNRALTAEEVGRLAEARSGLRGAMAGQVVTLDLAASDAGVVPNPATPDLPAKIVGQVSIVDADDGREGKAVRLDGNGFLEIAYDPRLDCLEGLTVAAWIRPTELPPNGMRIIDKSPVGVATAYLFDTWPGNALRLTTRDPHLIHGGALAVGTWTHVAGTVNVEADLAVLYVNGTEVAPSR